MTFIELVKARRSIREYTNVNIKREDLEKCVEAARNAPSACNSQPWKFVIVDELAIKEKVAKEAFSTLYKMNTFAQKASAFIVIVSEKIKPFAWIGEKIRNTDFRRIDIGIASSYITLQAQELNIGTCILGWFNEKKLKKILHVPKSKTIELIIALGYPLKSERPNKYLKDKNEVIAFNRY